jgi:hypothetical protein
VISQADLELCGPFEGHDRSLEACEALLYTLWPVKERRREGALFATKWWDHRTLHPVHATYLFHHLFATEIRRIIREHIDPAPPRVSATGKILDWNPIKAGDVFEAPAASRSTQFWKRKVLGLIRARQAADADGIPYGIFVREGLRHLYFGEGTWLMQRGWQQGGRTIMPEPNLLYGEEVLFAIRQAWLDQIASRVQAGLHPCWRLSNVNAHPDHAAHRAWLLQQLAERPVQEWAAARLVKEGLIDLNQACSAMRDPAALRRLLSTRANSV